MTVKNPSHSGQIYNNIACEYIAPRKSKPFTGRPSYYCSSAYCYWTY